MNHADMQVIEPIEDNMLQHQVRPLEINRSELTTNTFLKNSSRMGGTTAAKKKGHNDVQKSGADQLSAFDSIVEGLGAIRKDSEASSSYQSNI